MTAKTNCVEICAGLRRMGFSETGKTSVVPEDAIMNVVAKRKWTPLTISRYTGRDGYLVTFGYLKVVDSGYTLTGEDRDV